MENSLALHSSRKSSTQFPPRATESSSHNAQNKVPQYDYLIDSAREIIMATSKAKKIFSKICICFVFLQSIIGAANALPTCALYPLVSFLIPQFRLGTAFGL